jgi:hypothetical protein
MTRAENQLIELRGVSCLGLGTWGQKDVKNAGRSEHVYENRGKAKIENDRSDYVAENTQVIRYLKECQDLIERKCSYRNDGQLSRNPYQKNLDSAII